MSARDDALARLIPAVTGAPGELRLGVRVGTLVALYDDGAWVRVDEHAAPCRARSTVELCDEDVDREVVVAFDGGDPQRPLILGRVLASPTAPRNVVHARADGERLVLSSRERIVLECGAASITLTRAGKVLIHGHYVQSRATGVNSVKGGSVELN
ncbi:MAG TPA: DUF6484 domain-containing protein [Albitalea sp.]